MIVRVYERVLNATKPAEVIAAVDDERVYEAVVKAGGKAIMTAKIIQQVQIDWQK